MALKEGHRQSQDLDFFTQNKSFLAQELVNLFPDKIWEGEIVRDGLVFGKVLGAKVSFISYPSFLPQENPHKFGSLRILTDRDIAVMKIVAISQRGKKRDFIDLYWCVHHHLSLKETLALLPKQYPTVAHDYHHILKSLVYFADAEDDPMPRLLFRTEWRNVKSFFIKEVNKISKEIFLRM